MAAWTDLSSNFGYGTKLTSALMQAVRENITAAMEGASGSPGLGSAMVDSAQIVADAIGADHIANEAIQSRHYGSGTIEWDDIKAETIGTINIADDAITSDKIADDTIGANHIDDGSLTMALFDVDNTTVSIIANSFDPIEECFALPSGNYGFYPTFSIGNGAYINSLDLRIDFAHGGFDYNICGSLEIISTDYMPLITLDIDLLNSSVLPVTIYAKQYYITASGKIKWIFIKRDKFTGNILATYESWDHPSRMSNINIEQPFLRFNPSKHEIILINPTTGDLYDQEDLLDKGINPVDLLRQSDIILDNLLNFPKVEIEEKIINHKRRMRPRKLNKKHIKKQYIPEPVYTDIKLARIKFK